MMESPFGSGTPFATGTPAVFGWLQPPVSFANRLPMSTGVQAFGAPPTIAVAPLNIPPVPMISQEGYGYGSGIAAGAQPSPAGQGIAPGILSGVPGAFPGFVVPELATPQGLLSAVALRRGQPLGPTNDQEIEDFIYDAFELLPGSSEVEVRSEGGRVALTGNVPHKRLKHDVGEIAWTLPGINDVQNNVTIAPRRRARAAGREGEAQQLAASAKKQA